MCEVMQHTRRMWLTFSLVMVENSEASFPCFKHVMGLDSTSHTCLKNSKHMAAQLQL